ncbi:transcription factor 7-like [Stigmatopora argus]
MESFETINQLWLSSTFELIDWNLTSSPDALGEFPTFPAMQQQNTDAGFWIGLKNIVEVSTQGQVNQPPPDSTYGADPPQKSSSTLKKRTSVRGSPDYIKKPLNAFMLYAKENRPILKMLYEKKDSASINKLLGQMWKTLSQGDKQKYFEEAQRLNDEHAIMYPNWSTRDNYGKTKKKKCCHAARCTSQRPAATSVAAYPVFAPPVAGYPASPPQVSVYPVYAHPVTPYPASAPVTSPADYAVTAHQVDADPGFVQPLIT